AAARSAGRDPSEIGLHFQIWLSFGRDQAEAEAKLERSQHFRRSLVRQPGNTPEAELVRYRASNLIGSPEEVIEQIRVFERAGVTHMGVVFLGDTMDELLADME